MKEKWDESFVLVFPLKSNEKPCQYKRHEIEIAIGNYLEKIMFQLLTIIHIIID